MRMFTYVVAHDTGFAPNPFHGVCTLATCKPRIRSTARVGDWVVGTPGRRYADSPARVVFAMRVDEILDHAEYGEDPRFIAKRPSPTGEHGPRGDAIYHRTGTTVLRQRSNPFHGQAQQTHDLKSRRVLLSRRYAYFGRELPDLPPSLATIIKTGPGHRSRFPPERVGAFLRWLEAEVKRRGGWGLLGTPNSTGRRKIEAWKQAVADDPTCA